MFSGCLTTLCFSAVNNSTKTIMNYDSELINEWSKDMINDIISNLEQYPTSDYATDNLDDIMESVYSDEHVRLKSFEFWMITEVSKEKLACAGFYHVKEDHVKCFSCNVVIGNWGRGDDPFIEHVKHSIDCLFISGEQTNNVPLNDEKLRAELSGLIPLNSGSSRTTKLVDNTDSQNEIHHPCYKNIEQRIKTFETWPKGLNQTPEDLSRAGFFYLGTSDEVKCFYCGRCLKQWEKADKPTEEHKRHFWENCRFIRELYKTNENKSNQKSSVKASTTQINYLIDYMDSNPDFANRVINVSNDKLTFHSMWDSLTENLNELGPANKPAKSWREVWRNVKYNRKKYERKRPYFSTTLESTGSCDLDSTNDSLLQQNYNNIPSKILVLNPTVKTVQKYHEQNSTSRLQLEKLELDRKIRTLENAKIELELKKQQLDHIY